MAINVSASTCISCIADDWSASCGSPEETISMAQSLPILQMAHEEIARIMKTLDVRQDGEIDYDEFVASVAAEQSKLTDAKLQVAFDYMDADSDGVVSKGAAHIVRPTGAVLARETASQAEQASVSDAASEGVRTGVNVDLTWVVEGAPL